VDSNSNAPKRVLIASALTVLAVPALLWVNLRGGDSSTSDGSTDSATEVSVESTTTSPPPPPVRYEVAEDWQVRGHSRFSDTEAARRSSAQTEHLVIGSENIPEALDYSRDSDDEDATTTTQRTISLAEAGVFVAVTDPNYLTTTTSKPVWTGPTLPTTSKTRAG
jgi:hypothetical protein